MRPIVVDAGPLYAVVDRDDRHHQASTELFARYQPSELLVPAPVLVEVCWAIADHLDSDAEARFIDRVSKGAVTIIDLDDVDYQRTAELAGTYVDFPLGFVDAAVVAVAERRDLDTVATIDHRHFRAVRPAHVEHFTVVP